MKISIHKTAGVRAALRAAAVTDETQAAVWKMLAAILTMQNLTFTPRDGDQSEVREKIQCDVAQGYLQARPTPTHPSSLNDFPPSCKNN